MYTCNTNITIWTFIYIYEADEPMDVKWYIIKKSDEVIISHTNEFTWITKWETEWLWITNLSTLV